MSVAAITSRLSRPTSRRTVKSKFPLAGMFLRPATPSNSLPESPHNSQTRLSPLPEALYDRQCFKRAAASTVGPAPTENFGAAFEAIPATLIVVDAALRTISATSFSIAGFGEGPALWLCSIAGPTVVPATTQVVCRFWTGGTAGAQNFRHTLCVRLPYEVLSLTEPAIAAKLLPNVFYGRQER